MDAPSDRRKGEGLTFDYRMTEELAGDIKQAISKLRETFTGLPVWVVGTSRGSNSAANIKDGGPVGIVLTSSVGVSTRHGDNILDFALSDINILVLVVHLQGDRCAVTPVEGTQEIKARLAGSQSAAITLFDDGERGSGKKCGVKIHYGYPGFEQMIVDTIPAWIKSH